MDHGQMHGEEILGLLFVTQDGGPIPSLAHRRFTPGLGFGCAGPRSGPGLRLRLLQADLRRRPDRRHRIDHRAGGRPATRPHICRRLDRRQPFWPDHRHDNAARRSQMSAHHFGGLRRQSATRPQASQHSKRPHRNIRIAPVTYSLRI